MTCSDAGAYVLGALPAAERREFETHVESCLECRRQVSELAGLPGLLSRVTPADLADPPETPATLLPSLLSAVRRERRRRVARGLLAAAAVLAVLAGVGIVRSQDRSPQPTALAALVATHLHATATVDSASGGSRIELKCTYQGDAGSLSTPYRLVVTDRSGSRISLATWRVGPDHEATISGSVDLPPSQISTVEVRTTSGTPVLRWTR
jgi:Putative zinc-finger